MKIQAGGQRSIAEAGGVGVVPPAGEASPPPAPASSSSAPAVLRRTYAAPTVRELGQLGTTFKGAA